MHYGKDLSTCTNPIPRRYSCGLLTILQLLEGEADSGILFETIIRFLVLHPGLLKERAHRKATLLGKRWGKGCIFIWRQVTCLSVKKKLRPDETRRCVMTSRHL